MSVFDSLTPAFEGWFDAPMCDLPDRVEKIKQKSVLITFNLQLTSALNYGARPRSFIPFSHRQRKRRPKAP